MTLAEMLRARAEKVAALKAIADKCDAEKRAPTEEEEQQIAALADERDALQASIEERRSSTLKSAQAAGHTLAQPGSPARQLAAVVDRVIAAAEEDPKRGYRNIGEFGLDVARASLPNGQLGSPSDKFRLVAAMTQGDLAAGGVLVPPAFRTEIWSGVEERSESLLQYCDVFPMDAGTDSVEITAGAETSRADGSRQGGIQGRWKGETSSMSDSSPTFRGVKFEPQELYIFTVVSNKLLRNAAALANRLSVKAQDEIAFKIGDAIINGTGSGMPLGVLAGTAGTTACRIEVAIETGQTLASGLRKKNIDKMYSRLRANWRSGAIWLINQELEPQLLGLNAEVGVGGVPVALPPGGIAGVPTWSIYGRPVLPVEYCSAHGTVGDILFVNLKAYGVALRGMVDEAMSMHLYFDTARTAFKWIFEIDGQPWYKSALTAFKGTSGSNTYSPFVALATRS